MYSPLSGVEVMHRTITRSLVALVRDQSGATLVEYSLLIGLLVVPVMFGLGVLSPQITRIFNQAGEAIAAVPSDAGPAVGGNGNGGNGNGNGNGGNGGNGGGNGNGGNGGGNGNGKGGGKG
jgi:Flp pilus assembly pilin Flp